METDSRKEKESRHKESSGKVIEVINGGILSDRIVTKNLSFVAYIFALTLIYMLYSNTYDNHANQIKVNEATITNLTSDYNSRNAELLRYSRKDTIKVELLKKNSDLTEPTLPPTIIKYSQPE